MEFKLEVRGNARPHELPGNGASLVAFCSFAVSRGFGAVHPAIALADLLHDVHKVAMGPLTTFYDADIEDSEDREKLDLAWQPAGRLHETVAAMCEALGDREAVVFARRAGLDGLVVQAAALAQILSGLAPEAPVRMVYRL